MTYYGNDAKTERNEEIVFRHLCGETLTDLGEVYGLTRQRVHQIVRDAGVTPEESRAAYHEARLVTCRCETCGETFRRDAGKVERGGGRFCSTPCVRSAPTRWSDEYLIEHMQDLAWKLGRTPTQHDLNEHSPPHHTTYHHRFGSLRAAQEAAGLEPNQIGGNRHNGSTP